MRLSVRSIVCGTLCAACLSAAPSLAQTKNDQSPKFLLISREMLKPGKGGAHERTEQAWTRAYTQAKSRQYYTGLSSLTGPDRALFLIPLASLAEWQARMEEVSPAGQAMIDKASEADGDNLLSSEDSIFLLRPDLSTNTRGPALGTRFMEITAWLIKPGHEQEWEEAAKRYIKLAANHADVHWTAYQTAYGSADGTEYILLSAYKTMAEAEAAGDAESAIMREAGEKTATYFNDVSRSGVAWTHDNLFRVDPKLSFPSPEMIASEPKFWKPAAAPAAPAKKPE